MVIRSCNARTAANLGIATALTICLGACGGLNLTSSPTEVTEPGVGPEMPATIKADEIVGRWGLASFQNPNDRARTEAAARGQCKQPYVIGAGSSGGVIMHLADQATPQELRLKGSQDHPLHRQGCRDPLRQHGLCPLRGPRLICRSAGILRLTPKSKEPRFCRNRGSLVFVPGGYTKAQSNNASMSFCDA